MGRLDDKIVIITGAARGQGAAEAVLFAAEGATVYATDVLEPREALPAGVTFLHHDVASEAAWTEVVEAVTAAHGRVDVLVNNAGIFREGRLLETTLADYERVIAVNQVGVFLGMKAVAPHMRAAGRGSIVNVSSLAGMEGTVGAFAYGASKWAVRGMSKNAAQELGRFGVRVNSVHPGFIETDMMQQTPAVAAGKLERVLRGVPLGRAGTVDEVAGLVLFLASDESAYCTNGEFAVDGGLHR